MEVVGIIFDNVIFYATRKHMTIQQVEQRAGLANGSIGKWRAHDPGIVKVMAVAKVLGVSMNQITKGVSDVSK